MKMGSPSEQEAATPAFIVSWCLTNVASSVLIVLVNKYIYEYYGFPNMTLTCIHFLVTFLGLLICQQLKLFQIKKLPIIKMIPLSMTFCGFVVFTNLSLEHNTVGTYQIMKFLTTPCVMLISYFFYKTNYSHRVKLTLIPISLGVFINSYYDLEFSLVGILLASTGVFVTSLYQVWIGEKQKEFDVNSMQLLFYQAPLSAIILALVIPFFEPLTGPRGVFGNEWTLESLVCVFGSGVVAFLVNLSIYWVIGNTSALTYNMIGHLKFSMIVLGGLFLFQEPISFKQFCGMALSLSGFIFYTKFRMDENKNNSQNSKQALPTINK